jgi:2-succinyl-6-hydroxy-2,4-cyclohexadiene-1-carboxylate synthase
METGLLKHKTTGDPANPPLLLLHGFAGCKEDWDALSPALSHDSYLITVDLPGHGETGLLAPEHTTPMGASALIIATLDGLDIPTCDLLGYSMGGRLALYLLTTYPDRFSSVILESASPGLKTPRERKKRQADDAALAERIRTDGLEAFFAFWYSQPLFADIRQRTNRFEKLLQRRRGNTIDALIASLQYMGTGAQPSLWSHWSELPHPALLLVGEKDLKFRRIASQMADLSDNATMRIIEDAGHNTHLEQPEVFCRAVTEFLSEYRRG